MGKVDTCVISNEAIVEEDAVCTRCVIMQGAVVRKGARVHNAIIGPGAIVEGDNNLGKDEVVLLTGKVGL